MTTTQRFTRLLACTAVVALSTAAWAAPYPWPHAAVTRTIHNIQPPDGFHRVELTSGSFGAWLREVPLLPDGSPVLRWDGKPKPYQIGHFAVVDMDVGNQNLQQCADALMRLRAEYLWAMGRAGDVNKLPGNTHVWRGGDWPAYRRYLNGVMATTGTATMAQAMATPPKDHKLMPGDVLVQGGHPGHAILVLDAVEDAAGNRRVLLGQSYMPAQQFHVLKQPIGDSPWHPEAVVRTAGLKTLSWKKPFTDRDLRVFASWDKASRP